MNKISKSYKLTFCYIGLFVIYLLGCNSNNVPEPFIQKIIKPIRTGSSTTYLHGPVIIIAVYWILSRINNIKENKLINTVEKRIITMIVILSIFLCMQDIPIKIYKQFSTDLNSIYIYRGDANVKFRKEYGKVSVSGILSLLNCSGEPQKFYIKVKVPKLAYNDCEDEYITINKEYFIHPQKEKLIDIHQEIKSNIDDGHNFYEANAFEYILYNDESLVIFKGKEHNYRNAI